VINASFFALTEPNKWFGGFWLQQAGPAGLRAQAVRRELWRSEVKENYGSLKNSREQMGAGIISINFINL
jgi:hypothetical protein